MKSFDRHVTIYGKLWHVIISICRQNNSLWKQSEFTKHLTFSLVSASCLILLCQPWCMNQASKSSHKIKIKRDLTTSLQRPHIYEFLMEGYLNRRRKLGFLVIIKRLFKFKPRDMQNIIWKKKMYYKVTHSYNFCRESKSPKFSWLAWKFFLRNCNFFVFCFFACRNPVALDWRRSHLNTKKEVIQAVHLPSIWW